MDKKEYMRELEKNLKRLFHSNRFSSEDVKNEIDGALKFYSDYFDDAGEQNERKAIKGLGSPSRVAAMIYSDYTVNNLETVPMTAKKGVSTVWLAITAAFAAPIAIPVALAVLIVVISVIITLYLFILSFTLILFSLFIAASAYTVAGIATLTQHLSTGLMFTGIGVFFIGVTLLAANPMTALIKKIHKLILRMLLGIIRLIPRRKERNGYAG